MAQRADPGPMIATAANHYPKVGDGPGEQRLRQVLNRLDRGRATPEDVSAAEDWATERALAEQEEAGLDLVTDGQIRWQDPITREAGGLRGFEIGGLLRWFETNTYYRQPVAVGEIAWERPILVQDLRFALAHASRPVKAVVTGPYTLATLSNTEARGHRTVTLELARALRQELLVLAAEGPAWLQIDEPAITGNPSVRYPRDFGLFREAMSVLTEDVPGRLSLRLHHGSADDVEGLFELPFQMIGLDLVQGSASWSLVDRWPAHLGLDIGIVDARNVRLESGDDLRSQVARGRRRLAAETALHVSPSCGLEFLPRADARRKLALVATAAHDEGEVVA
ncbi:MAG: hypothetical protein ACREQM_17220 [Candidatus Dormibacteraceae bacterium]